MHEVRTKFLYQVQGQADFQHCEVLKVVKLTVMTVCDDRRLSIEVLGAVGMPSISITGLTLCLLYGSLCLVGLNLVLGKVAYWVLSSRTGQNSRTGPCSSRTGKVRVSVGTYILRAQVYSTSASVLKWHSHGGSQEECRLKDSKVREIFHQG